MMDRTVLAWGSRGLDGGAVLWKILRTAVGEQ